MVSLALSSPKNLFRFVTRLTAKSGFCGHEEIFCQQSQLSETQQKVPNSTVKFLGSFRSIAGQKPLIYCVS